jgi:Predicted transcriptional regulators
MDVKNLGENLASYRKKSGLSQEELSEKLHVSRQAISRWECGDAVPDTENLIELGALYGVTLDELIKGSAAVEASSSAAPAIPVAHKIKKRDPSLGVALCLGLSVLASIAFLLWGFLIPGSWGVAWVSFLAIPFLITAVIAVKAKRTTIFCFPVVALATFYVLSWYTGMWHPLWLIFLSIPVYYCIAVLFDRAIRKKSV